jgi:hypothetical protein
MPLKSVLKRLRNLSGQALTGILTGGALLKARLNFLSIIHSIIQLP